MAFEYSLVFLSLHYNCTKHLAESIGIIPFADRTAYIKDSTVAS